MDTILAAFEPEALQGAAVLMAEAGKLAALPEESWASLLQAAQVPALLLALRAPMTACPILCRGPQAVSSSSTVPLSIVSSTTQQHLLHEDVTHFSLQPAYGACVL